MAGQGEWRELLRVIIGERKEPDHRKRVPRDVEAALPLCGRKRNLPDSCFLPPSTTAYRLRSFPFLHVFYLFASYDQSTSLTPRFVSRLAIVPDRVS